MERDHPTELIPMQHAVSEFEIVLRGYDRGQVRETVEQLASDLRIALTDRDSAVARSSDLASQLSAMHGELESLRRKAASSAAPTYESMGERIASMLRLAEEESAEIRRTALHDTAGAREETTRLHGAADQVRRAADVQAAAVLGEAERKAAAILEIAQRKAEQRMTEANAEATEIVSSSTARQREADQDYELASRARRTAAHKDETDRHRVSTAQATQRVGEATAAAAALVATATDEGAGIVATARAEERRLDQLREHCIGQLRAVRSLLGVLPGEEPAVEAEPVTVTKPPTAAAPVSLAKPAAGPTAARPVQRDQTAGR